MHNYHTTGDHSHHAIIADHEIRAWCADIPTTAIYMAECEPQAICTTIRNGRSYTSHSDSALYT